MRVVLADEVSPDCAGYGTLNRTNRSIWDRSTWTLAAKIRGLSRNRPSSRHFAGRRPIDTQDRRQCSNEGKGARYPENGVLDPQGKAVGHALEGLGFSGVDGVRIGRYIEFNLEETDRDKATAQSDEMCRKLLANTVIENYSIEIEQ